MFDILHKDIHNLQKWKESLGMLISVNDGANRLIGIRQSPRKKHYDASAYHNYCHLKFKIQCLGYKFAFYAKIIRRLLKNFF